MAEKGNIETLWQEVTCVDCGFRVAGFDLAIVGQQPSIGRIKVALRPLLDQIGPQRCSDCERKHQRPRCDHRLYCPEHEALEA